jgi:hypothetical protein
MGNARTSASLSSESLRSRSAAIPALPRRATIFLVFLVFFVARRGSGGIGWRDRVGNARTNDGLSSENLRSSSAEIPALPRRATIFLVFLVFFVARRGSGGMGAATDNQRRFAACDDGLRRDSELASARWARR